MNLEGTVNCLNLYEYIFCIYYMQILGSRILFKTTFVLIINNSMIMHI